MNELTFKQKIIFISIVVGVILAVFLTGVGVGYKSATKSSATESSAITKLKSDVSKLESDNERLTIERDQLISDLSASNKKLESIAGELKQCNSEFTEQSIEYSERIKNANGNAVEYNRIYTERVIKLCGSMERAIRAIADACGYYYEETE